MEINTMTEEFKDIDNDPMRMAEYKERERLSRVLEEYYKLKSEYKDMSEVELFVLAHDIIGRKEKDIGSK